MTRSGNESEQPGLNPIGSRLPKIDPSPKGSALTPMQSPENSETTGTRSLDEQHSKSIGAGHFATDAEPLLSVALAKNDAYAVETIVRRLCVQGRMSSLVSIRVNHEYDWTGLEWKCEPSQEDRDYVAAIAARILQPGPPANIATVATKCLMVTKASARDDVDVEGMLSIFAEELAPYPGDIVATAFRDWSRKNVFWPSLADIIKTCERFTAERQWLRDLASMPGQHPLPLPRQAPRRTQEELKADNARLIEILSRPEERPPAYAPRTRALRNGPFDGLPPGQDPWGQIPGTGTIGIGVPISRPPEFDGDGGPL